MRIRNRSYGRDLRIAETIREELSTLIRYKLRDPRVDPMLISITEVHVTRNLSRADIYIVLLHTQNEEKRKLFVSVLQAAAGFLRSGLAARNSLRITPALYFHYDDLVERGARLEGLIRQLDTAGNHAEIDDGS